MQTLLRIFTSNQHPKSSLTETQGQHPSKGRGWQRRRRWGTPKASHANITLSLGRLAWFPAQPPWCPTLSISDRSLGLVTSTECWKGPARVPLGTMPHADTILLEQFLFLMLVEGIPTIRVSGSFVLLGLLGPHFCFERESFGIRLLLTCQAEKWIWAKGSVASFWLFMRSCFFLLTKTMGSFKT